MYVVSSVVLNVVLQAEDEKVAAAEAYMTVVAWLTVAVSTPQPTRVPFGLWTTTACPRLPAYPYPFPV